MKDIRLKQRLIRLVEQLSQKPTASVPLACGNWAQTKASYRFWDNKKVEIDTWRNLPGDFPAWQTVYTCFRNWRLIHDVGNGYLPLGCSSSFTTTTAERIRVATETMGGGTHLWLAILVLPIKQRP